MPGLPVAEEVDVDEEDSVNLLQRRWADPVYDPSSPAAAALDASIPPSLLLVLLVLLGPGLGLGLGLAPRSAPPVEVVKSYLFPEDQVVVSLEVMAESRRAPNRWSVIFTPPSPIHSLVVPS